MSDKIAKVYENELEAIKDSRTRDMSLYFASNFKDRSAWVVAISQHQAELALTAYVWPLTKLNKRFRDERYTTLLEEAWRGVQEGGSSE